MEDKQPQSEPKKQFKGRPRRHQDRRSERPAEEFEQKIVNLARVTRVMAGGKRMKFRVCMVIGDKKGRVGMGLAKGADVSQAIQKAVTKAKKNLINVPIINSTIPHQISVKLGAARIMMKPARQGVGIKAGGVLRTVLSLAGVQDVTAKILGTNNQVNNVQAAIKALNSFVPKSAYKASKK